MASDRSRFSYDEAQQYRSVVLQQGKVLLDSDFDEAQQILTEETRREALDFVGPTGTPDDGYRISVPSPAASFNFGIGAGTMYVGGLRVSIPGDPKASTPPFNASKQFDWLSPDAPPNGAAKEYVWLELIEHEVSALEDNALLEPALGGPDTAQRARILQRIRRAATTAGTCGDALAAQLASWTKEGRVFEETTARLLSNARLQVSHVASVVTPNPCDPIAHGGFLGAENQLIRVRISGASKLVWAYDDASALYRVSEIRAGNQLVLANVPVDDAHQPRQTQVAELLRATTRLANGNPVTEPFGPIVKLAGDYRADDRTLKLAALPATHDTVTDNNPLFVRIWESEESFAANAPVQLKDSGLQVTLTLAAGSAFTDGDFWVFAVRPKLPADVFPARYLKAPQPPEGPRRWVCGLAVLDWTSATAGKVVSDCRLPFDNLVELTARKEQNTCCSVMITPADVKDGSLQHIVDRARQSNNFKVCMLPGIYELTEPIAVEKAHGQVTFESCRGGVVIHGQGGRMKDGVVQLTNATGITFTGIQFRLAAVVLPRRGSDRVNTATCIGIRMIDSNVVTVEDCQFVYPAASTLASEDINAALGAGILSNGRSSSFTVRDCTFAAPVSRGEGAGVTWVGVAAVPGFFATAIRQPGTLNPNLDLTNIGNVLTREAANLGTRADTVTRPVDGNVAILAPNAGGIRAGEPVTPPPVRPGRPTTDSGIIITDIDRPGGIDFTNPIDGAVIGIPPVVIFQPPITLPPVKAPVTARGSMLPASLDGVEIVENRFANMHTAVLFCGDVGSLRIRDNDVTRATNGVVLIAGRWLPAVMFMTRARIDRIFPTLSSVLAAAANNQLWNAVQAAAGLVASFAHPGVATLISAMISIDLPPPQSTNPALVQLTDGLDENGWLQPFVEAATSAFTASVSPLDLFDVNGHKNLTQQVQARLNELWSQATPASLFVDSVAAGLGFGSLLQSADSTSALDLDCSGNSVRGATGAALLLIEDPRDTASLAIVCDNRFTNQSLSLPTAVTAFVSRSDVNGNLVQNGSKFEWKNSEAFRLFWSMLVIPGTRPPDDLPQTGGDQLRRFIPPLVAIMSNVFKGWPVLPPRPMPDQRDAFADSWLFLNTVSW